MGLYEGAEEVLAGADYSRDAVTGIAHCCSAGFSHCPVYLYIVLDRAIRFGAVRGWRILSGRYCLVCERLIIGESSIEESAMGLTLYAR